MADRYIDYNRGNDSNDGLTTATPWQNLSKLTSITAVSGDTIYLADDSVWNITAHINIPSNWTGTETNPITITKYHPVGSVGNMPTISRKRAILASEWTYDSTNNSWYMQWFPTVDVEWGSYITMGSQYGLRQEAAFPISTVPRAWKNALDNVPTEAGTDGAGRIYVYAPSTTNPTDYYGSVYFAPHSRGTFSFSATGTYVVIKDIKSKDGGGLVSWYSNSGNRTLVVDGCVFENTGVGIYQTAETAGISNLTVKNCDFSGGITAYINSYATAGLGQFLVEHNTFRGGNAGYPQGNVYMQGLNGKNIVRFNNHNGAIHGTQFHTQDGCAIYAEVGSNNVEVYGNYIKDCYLAMQDNSGRNTKWYSNIMVDCHQQMKVTDASSVGSTNHSFWNNTMIGAGKPLTQYGGVESGGIGWYCFDDFAISLKNNLFTIHEDAVAQPAIETGLASTGVIQDTLAYGFTAVAQTYQGGTCPITPSGSITTDPYLNGFTPKQNSPCINAGIEITPYIRDFYGKEIVDTTPDIGAIQSKVIKYPALSTIYIDPTVSGTGSGTFADPYKSWASVTWTTGTHYLQKAGTTYLASNGVISVTVGGTSERTRVVIGAYDPTTGARITGVSSQKAKFDGTGTNITLRTGASIHYVTFENLEVYGTGATSSVGIYLGSNNVTPSRFCEVLDCYVHDTIQPSSGDGDGIAGFACDLRVARCKVINIPDDGMWFQGENILIEDCFVKDVALSGRVAGDCIQINGDATLGSSGGIIRNNILDHSNSAIKQALIYQGHNSTSDGVRIYGNTMYMLNNQVTTCNTLLVGIKNAIVYGNKIYGGYFGIISDHATTNYLATNALITGNLVVGSHYGINQGPTTNGGTRIYNNTIIGSTNTAVYCDTDTTVKVKNNIVAGGVNGIALEFGAEEDYNCYYDNSGTDRSTLGGGAAVLGSNSIQLDPLFVNADNNYRLQAGSPCNNTGIYINGARDITGKQISTTPDIGCYQDEIARDSTNEREVISNRPLK